MSLIVLLVVAAGVGIAWTTVGKRDVPRTAPTKVSPFTKAARADLYGDAINEGLLMRPGDQFVTGLVTFDDTTLDRFVTGTGGAFGAMSSTFRRLQTGFVRSYALSVLLGALVVVVAMLAVQL